MIMDKIMFIPKTETYEPSQLIIYMTKFQLGFIEVTFRLLRSELAGLSQAGIQHLKQLRPDLAKKFINILTIGGYGWIWFTSDDMTLTELNYKDVIKKLKHGEEVEFVDQGHSMKPIKLSWTGIQFHW